MMKNFVKFAVMMGLVLTAVLPVCAEPSEMLKSIYDALLSEKSDFSQGKAIYAEYYPETKYDAELTDEAITISISGNEYMEDGSWTFVEDGDYLTITIPSDDFSGYMQARNILNAVGICYDMDSHLLNGYINGLSAKDLVNKYFVTKNNEENKTAAISIYAAGPYDMKELDEMILDKDSLDFEPLTEDFLSQASSVGKVFMLANGNADDLKILVGEYGELDNVAYQSLVNVVNVLQPKGWEAFASEYKELADAETAAYSVKLNPSEEEVREMIEEDRTGWSFILTHFGE